MGATANDAGVVTALPSGDQVVGTHLVMSARRTWWTALGWRLRSNRVVDTPVPTCGPDDDVRDLLARLADAYAAVVVVLNDHPVVRGGFASIASTALTR